MNRPHKKRGRPSAYSTDRADRICDLLLKGLSLAAVSRRRGMPTQTTMLKWLAAHPDFEVRYVHARQYYAEVMFDEMIQIADDASGDWIEKVSGKNGEVFMAANLEHINRSKLRVDTRRWILARMAPLKYGDKLSIDKRVTGSLDVTVQADLDTSALTPAEKRTLIGLLDKIKTRKDEK